MKEKILVIGACGQIGKELTQALLLKYGADAVIASDIVEEHQAGNNESRYQRLDVTDKTGIQALVAKEKVTQIYLLAAMLSANAEQHPLMAWKINMDGLLNVLEVAREEKLNKVFWPSSIAVFGPSSPKENCPQHTITEPSTIYGISKCAGEYWCNYYRNKFGLDIRSIRYPGLISYQAAPGGGTTDYAVDIFHSAIQGKAFSCFLKEDTVLPMMYMPDAIRATLELMDAPPEAVENETSYNLAGMSFSPSEIYASIKKFVPDFKITYQPDFREQIAQSWPRSIDDQFARSDWNWRAKYDLHDMVKDMLLNLGHPLHLQNAALESQTRHKI